jgi:hypothetical protein
MRLRRQQRSYSASKPDKIKPKSFCKHSWLFRVAVVEQTFTTNVLQVLVPAAAAAAL